MTTNGLAKLYGRLTPAERLPLLLAAEARGDEAEAGRLAASAPREGFRLPDYHGLAEGLLLAAQLHLLDLLDTAALFWRLGGHLEEWSNGGRQDEARLRRLGGAVRAAAQLFVAKFDGWRQFCADLSLDPDLLFHDLPGAATVRRTEEAARLLAYSPEEAAAWRRDCGRDEARALTAEAVAASLRALVDGRADFWGQAGTGGAGAGGPT